jgi:hypothetical protein
LDRARAGKSIAARIAMIAMTTSNSINVNALGFRISCYQLTGEATAPAGRNAMQLPVVIPGD